MPSRAQEQPDGSRYSLAHLTLIGCSAPELVYIAARAGYDAVSPRFIPMHVPGEHPCSPADKGLVAATKTALATTGLEVLDIEIARITEDCDPRAFEPALELGGELGAERLIMSAWTKTRDDRDFLVDCYGETCDLAAPYGLTVDLEFPSFSRLRTLDEALDIVRAADRPNGGILVDTLYLHLSRVDIGEAAARARRPASLPPHLRLPARHRRHERGHDPSSPATPASIRARAGSTSPASSSACRRSTTPSSCPTRAGWPSWASRSTPAVACSTPSAPSAPPAPSAVRPTHHRITFEPPRERHEQRAH